MFSIHVMVLHISFTLSSKTLENTYSCIFLEIFGISADVRWHLEGNSFNVIRILISWNSHLYFVLVDIHSKGHVCN